MIRYQIVDKFAILE